MSPIDDPSLGEVFRSQQRVERKIDTMAEQVDVLGKGVDTTKRDLEALAAIVAEHDQFKRWTIQLVLGFVILSVLGAVFVIATMPGGAAG